MRKIDVSGWRQRAGRINGQHISLKLPAFSSSFKAQQTLPPELTKPVP
jgi:hypothetical protein